MSRIGKLPIDVPKGVTVQVNGSVFHAKGPLGELTQDFRSEVAVGLEDSQVIVTVTGESKGHSSYHGLYRSLFANMVEGVSKGFEKKLLITGVGYRANLEKIDGKDNIVFKARELGFSHPIFYPLPDTISAELPNNTTIVIKGPNKALVGQVAAKVRALRPPDAYKGKGIRYSDEIVRTKVGKRGK